MFKIDCDECPKMHYCCLDGASIDLQEAKNILAFDLPGRFFKLEEDKTCPSGYSVDTSFNDGRCTFLTDDGLCSVHKIDYGLKPKVCREFPYENGRIAYYADELCLLHMERLKQRKTKRTGARRI